MPETVEIEMKRHEWKERDGAETCQYRATHHAGRWELHTFRDGDEDWVLHEPIPLEQLQKLRDVLLRKYQRRRVPFEHVEQIEKMIQSAQ